jgi:hypothetical protein
MSLINDALKKAQQLQTQGQAHSAGSGQASPQPIPGGVPTAPSAPNTSGAPSRPADSTHSASSGQAGSPRASAGRDRPLPGQLFMLLAFGAGVLIAVSVLATVYLLRQPASPVVAQAPAAPSPTAAAAPILPEKPAALAPVIKTSPPALSQTAPPPPLAQNPAPTPAPTVEKFPATTPAPAVAVTPTVSVIPQPAVPPAPPVLRSLSEGGSLPAVSTPALPVLHSPEPVERGEGGSLSNGPDPTKPDPKILAYIDALQVAGIRVSDTGSKVLMNDRVYRENEIVDHLLGLRLKKVESDVLTFVDERGVTYTKNF